MTITDHISFGVLLLGFFVVLASLWQRWREATQTRDLLLGLLVVFMSLSIRYLLAWLPEQYEAVLASDLLLATAAGTMAPVVITLLKLVRPSAPFETSQYFATWRFTDAATPGMLCMSITVEFDRTNTSRSPKPCLMGAGFEPCLWATEYVVNKIRCAKSRMDFHTMEGRYVSLPFISTGRDFQLDKDHQDYDHALIPPGETLWLQWTGTVDVPEAYWDNLVGGSDLIGQAEFRAEDATENGELVFLLRSSGDDGQTQKATNIEEDTLASGVHLPVEFTRPCPNRCQLYWIPRARAADLTEIAALR